MLKDMKVTVMRMVEGIVDRDDCKEFEGCEDGGGEGEAYKGVMMLGGDNGKW